MAVIQRTPCIGLTFFCPLIGSADLSFWLQCIILYRGFLGRFPNLQRVLFWKCPSRCVWIPSVSHLLLSLPLWWIFKFSAVLIDSPGFLSFHFQIGWSILLLQSWKQENSKQIASWKYSFAVPLTLSSNAGIFRRSANCKATALNNFFSYTHHSFPHCPPASWHARISSSAERSMVQIV